MIGDLLYSLRTLRRNPGFTTIVVLTVGLGIGVSTTVFSLVNALLLRPIAGVEKLEGSIAIETSIQGEPAPSAYLDFVDFQNASRSFADLAAFKSRRMDLTAAGTTERIDGMMVTSSYFVTLGLSPFLGRFFLPEEGDGANAGTVAVLTHGLWVRRFGSDRQIIGQTIVLNGRAFTVVGIAPERFTSTTLSARAELFVPMSMQPHFMPGTGNLLQQRGWSGISILGRLEPGVSLDQAQEEINVIAARLAQEYPETNQDRRHEIVPFTTARLAPEARRAVVGLSGLLLGVTVTVLAVVCVNVANLLLARFSRRYREVLVRQAIGAGRGRIVRMVLAECLILGLLGGAVGLLVVPWGTGLLGQLPFPVELDPSPDWRVVAFALLVSLFATLTFGLAPALRVSRLDLTPALRSEESGGGGRRKRKLMRVLVVAQVGLSLPVLALAGLLVRTFVNLQNVDLGFDPKNVLTATVDPTLQGYRETALKQFYAEALERVSALAGVRMTTVSSRIPSRGDDVVGVTLRGQDAMPQTGPPIGVALVGARYFQTLGIPIVRGRAISEEDSGDAPPVIILNQSAAGWYQELTGNDPLGARISLYGLPGPFAEVVGIAADSRTDGLRQEARPFVYEPYSQTPLTDMGSQMTLLVRTEGDAASLAAGIRGVLRSLDPDIPVMGIMTLEDHLAETLAPERLASGVISLSGLMALVLSAVGLFGVLSYSVSQRRREVGIHMALGARRADVEKRVVKEGLALTAWGLAAGLGGALASAHVVASFLYGVAPTDPLTLVAACTILMVVAVAASYLPARRAGRVDPIEVLRYE